MTEEILKADRTSRRLIVMLGVSLGVLLPFLCVYLQKYFVNITQLAKASPQQALEIFRPTLTVLILLVAIPATIFGLYLVFFAVKVCETDKFPPPKTRVLIDTKVVTGKPARQRAMLGFLLGGLFVFYGIVFPCVAFYMIDSAIEEGKHKGAHSLSFSNGQPVVAVK